LKNALIFLSRHSPPRDREAPVADADLRGREKQLRDSLVAITHVVECGAVLEHVVPVGLGQRLAHLGRRQPGSKHTRHEPTHAGADHTIHRHPQLLQHLEHADVCGAARTATTEHEADARPRRFVRGVDAGGDGD